MSEGLNTAELAKTLITLVLMSAKSWSEVEESTIARSWSKLLSLADVAEHEETDTNLEIDSVLAKLHVPPKERSECLMLDNTDPGYHKYTEELLAHVTGGW